MLDSLSHRFAGPGVAPPWARARLIAIVISGLFAPGLQAQSEMNRLLDPRLGRLAATLETATTRFEQTDTKRQDADLGMVDYDLNLLAPLQQSQVSELALTVGVGALDVASRAQLPDSAEPLPDHLWNIRLGGSYRQYLDEQRLFGVWGHIGSPSDKPFESIEEVEVNLTGMLRIKAQDYDAWILLLNFSNSRDFLRYVPIPGAGYLYQPNREFQALVGAPLTFFNWRFREKWRLFASYILPRKAQAELSYATTEKTKLYARFDWRSRRWFRRQRRDDGEHLKDYEKLVQGGLAWNLTATCTVDLHGGYAFDRFFYEGADYDDRDFNRISFADGPFAGIDASVRF